MYCGSAGIDVPLLRNSGERSASVNSCAIARRDATRCWAAWVSRSPVPSTLGNQSELDRASQPENAKALALPKARARKRRRDSSTRFFIDGLPIDAVAPGDHRTHVIPESACNYLEDVDRHEPDQKPNDNEVDRPCSLPAAKHIDPARNDRVQPWRHRKTRQDDEGQ